MTPGDHLKIDSEMLDGPGPNWKKNCFFPGSI
jgi:hypothetical protein